MSLNDEELERYARHIVLREIGGSGQRALKAATVAVIGAGGIGSPAIQYLAAAGIGMLRVIDDDDVGLSNLQRQTLFGSEDIGSPKVFAAQHDIAKINPHVTYQPINQRLTAHNAVEILAGASVIIDGCDNFATRLVVADAALALRIPLVSAAVGQFEGQLATYRGWEADKPCYRCLVGDDPDRPDISCADQGVLGALTGVMGSLAAMEALRAITGFGQDSAGRLLLFDALTLTARTLRLPKDPGCRCAA